MMDHARHGAACVLLFLLSGPTFAGEAVDVRDFGAVGDGERDDAPALERAIEAGLGGEVYLPPGTYLIDSRIYVELTDDLTLRGDPKRTTLLFAGDNSISFVSPKVAETELESNALRGERSLHVAGSLAAVATEDLVYLTEARVTETHWDSPARHLAAVRSVEADAKNVSLADPLNFDFTAQGKAQVHFYRPMGSLTLEGLDLKVRDADRSRRLMIELRFLRDVIGRDLRILGNTDFEHRGIGLSGCLNGRFENVHGDQVQYAFMVNYSRDIHFERVRSYNSRHPVTIAAWSDGVHVRHLRGHNNQGIVEAHPSFNVHYENVIAGKEQGASNLRSVGGSIRNAVFINTGEPVRPYFQTVALVNQDIYDQYTFEMENVHWRAAAPVFVHNVGKAVFRNVQSMDLDGQPLGVGVGGGVGRVVFEDTLPHRMQRKGYQYLSADLWSVVGPFHEMERRAVKTGMENAFGPERELLESGAVDLDAQYEGVDAQSVHWQRLEPGEELTGTAAHHMREGVNFTLMLDMPRLGIAYALTHIHSPDARRVPFLLGCDFWAKGWLNGEPIQSDRPSEAAQADGATFRNFAMQQAELDLRRGTNVLLIKVHGGTGGASFSAGLANDGDLQFSPVPFDNDADVP